MLNAIPVHNCNQTRSQGEIGGQISPLTEKFLQFSRVFEKKFQKFPP